MDYSQLQTCPLFAGVSAEELPAMLSCLSARSARYDRNQPIFREGDRAEWVGVVLTGEVQIIREDYLGARSVLTALGPGQMFGEVFSCAEVEQLPVSAVASADSEILLLSCRRLLTTCTSACAFHSRVIHNLLRVVARKNLMLNQKIEFLTRRTTREKLMAYLSAQSRAQHSRTFTIPFDRQALADYLGVERSAMSAELSKLRRDGVIDYHKNSFRLL